MFHKMQRTPAPIFNHKKRPRQAVISNPQTIDGLGSNQATTTGQCSELMPVGGFAYTAPQRNFQKNSSRPISQTESRYTAFSGGNTVPQKEATGSLQQRPLKIQESSNHNMGQHLRDGQKMESFRPRGNITARNQANYVREMKPHNVGNARLIFSSQSGQQHESYKFQQRELKVEKSQEKINLFGSGDCSQNTRLKTINNSCNMCDQGNYVGCYGDTGQQTYRRSTLIKSDSCVNQNAVNEKSHSRQRIVKEVDKSLRFITTTVQGVKHWSNFKDNINMIYEVFGILDSALMRKSDGVGKVFQLRDEKDSMQCVFNEIVLDVNVIMMGAACRAGNAYPSDASDFTCDVYEDRTLPRLIRGHWHRCVGTYDKEQKIFKCVSIRSTTLEEKKKSISNIDLCENSLSSLRRSISEQ